MRFIATEHSDFVVEVLTRENFAIVQPHSMSNIYLQQHEGLFEVGSDILQIGVSTNKTTLLASHNVISCKNDSFHLFRSMSSNEREPVSGLS